MMIFWNSFYKMYYVPNCEVDTLFEDELDPLTEEELELLPEDELELLLDEPELFPNDEPKILPKDDPKLLPKDDLELMPRDDPELLPIDVLELLPDDEDDEEELWDDGELPDDELAIESIEKYLRILRNIENCIEKLKFSCHEYWNYV